MIDAAHLDRLHAGIRAWEGRRERVHALQEQRHAAAGNVILTYCQPQWRLVVFDRTGHGVLLSHWHRTLDEALDALLDWFYPEEAE